MVDFHWQNGYGAFSLSPSHLHNLCEYIKNQEEHHKQADFKDELLRLFKKTMSFMTNNIYGINIAPLRGAGMGMYVSQGSRRYYVAWSPWAIVITFASQRLHRLLLQNIKSVRNFL